MPAFKQTIGLAACAVYLQGCGSSNQAPAKDKDFLAKYKHMSLEELEQQAPSTQELKAILQKRLEGTQFHLTAKKMAEKARIAIRENHGEMSHQAHEKLHEIMHHLPEQVQQATGAKSIDAAFKEMHEKLHEVASMAPKAQTQIKQLAADLEQNLGSYEAQGESAVKQIIPEIRATAEQGTADLMDLLKKVTGKDQQDKITEVQAAIMGTVNKTLKTIGKQDLKSYVDWRQIEHFAKDNLRTVRDFKGDGLVSAGMKNVSQLESQVSQVVRGVAEKVQKSENDVVKMGDSLINQIDQQVVGAAKAIQV